MMLVPLLWDLIIDINDSHHTHPGFNFQSMNTNSICLFACRAHIRYIVIKVLSPLFVSSINGKKVRFQQTNVGNELRVLPTDDAGSDD